jgi:hypothetical protein
MRKPIIAVLFLVAALCLASFTVAGVTAGSLKAGDIVYVCPCGEACACKTISDTAETCRCGKDLAKGSVVRVEGDSAVVSVDGKEQTFTFGSKGCGDCNKCQNCDQGMKKPGCANCDKGAKK